ncbi:(deoxy)nucleoside triphosphate pyrophosphohydrolase [uncultured Desulfovibrio sp.]|uniref:(deoxy)nucleoside triphosphate pyrophosphohydrolase n=1 Tax=uncultured Desulfovibrio sp. TaxID=167968 RepID=UPI00261F7E95|nr:(deoxy)nucleoside triphosphate pyrophosphohydrolase [uncultured Desulfovibrio sp.]
MTAPLRSLDVAAGIIWRQGCFLAACRPQGKPHAGFWEFPGGKLEQNERPLDALCRELREELTIHVQRAAFWRLAEHDYPERGIHVRLHFFHVTAFLGTPCRAEGQTLRWVHASEALTLPFLPADRAIVAALADEKSTFLPGPAAEAAAS